jgi:flagellar biogenesis protein FliO
VTTYAATRESTILRLYLGLFALVALVVLLAAGWLRFLAPRHATSSVRDVSWLPRGER